MAFKRPGTAGGKTGTAAAKASKFEYRPRTAAEVHKRAHQGGGGKEGFVKSDVNTWTPKDGDNRIRILPPTWEDAGHFGFECFAHYSIGPDNSSFLCRQKNPAVGEPCPICEARVELDRDGDEEAAKELNWRKRVAMWIIDRSEESKGPQLWFAPWTLDQEIAKQSTDETGEALPLDHPAEGYDVIFTREQIKGSPPKYVGVKIGRKPSPVFDDDDEVSKVLEYITENPIPDCLVYHDYDHMAATFAGAPPKKEAAEKPAGKPKVGSKPEVTKPSGKPAFGKKKPEPEPEPDPEDDALPTWAEVHEMDEDTLTGFSEAHEIDFGDEEFDDLAAVADFVCAHLEIEDPDAEPEPEPEPEPVKAKPKFGAKKPAAKAEPEPPAKSSWKDKLAKFKK